MKNIFIATSTFAKYSNEPIKILEGKGLIIYCNPLYRKINTDELIKYSKNAFGIIAGTETYSDEILDQLPNLKFISRLGVGMDNIDLEFAEKRGIKVFKTTTTPAPAVSELVLGLLIDLSRKISQSNQSLKNGTWHKRMGNLLQGKTLGVIGLGNIGKALVKLSSGFHFKVLAFDKNEDKSFAKKYNVSFCDLTTLLMNSDIVSIHLNLTNQTKYLIDQNNIKLMKPNAIIINSSRGGIIDEKALYKALKNKRIGGAGLDVFENEPYIGPLTELKNVILTPHIGTYAKEIRIKMEIEAVENLIRGLNET